MNNIHVKVYVTKKMRTPPINVVYGSSGVGIEIEIMDYDLPAGSTADARATGKFSTAVYKNPCTVDGNTITMHPETGFFVPGGNEFQVVITAAGKTILSFVMDAICDRDIGEGNFPAKPEQVLPLVQRAEKAATQSEAAAARAEEVKDSIPADYTELSDGVNQIKSDKTIVKVDTQNIFNVNAEPYIKNKILAISNGSVIQAGYDNHDIWKIDNFKYNTLYYFYTDGDDYGTTPHIAFLYSDGTIELCKSPDGADYATGIHGSFTITDKNIVAILLQDKINCNNNYISEIDTFTPFSMKLNQNVPEIVCDIVVAKDGSGNYLTLTSAVKAAKDGDIIFVKCGVYDSEEVEAYGKDISIIGENVEKTIIKNGLDLYARPPIEMTTGLLRNLTFDSYGVDGGDNRHAYALHCDNDCLTDNTFTVENCRFHSHSGYGAVGLGLRGNCVVTFRDCLFDCDTGSAFFGNESANQQSHGIQKLNFLNCVFNNNTDSASTAIFRGMKVDGNTVECTFINNVFASDDSVVSIRFDYSIPEYIGTGTTMGNLGIINWNKTDISHGNTINELNGYREGIVRIIES